MSDLIDQLKADMPKQAKRRYGSQTGSQFFTDPNLSQYGDYINPYLNGGAIGDLASQYANTPVVSGYWETDPTTGQEGSFVPTTSLMGSAGALNDLRNLPTPQTFYEWLAANLQAQGAWNPDLMQSEAYQALAGIENSAPYQGLEQIIGQLQNPEQDLAGAEAAAAAALGFTTTDAQGNVVGDVAAYQQFKESTRQQLESGIMGQSGVLGTDYEQAYNRQTQSEIEQITQQNTQMIESLGLRSSAAAFSKMSEVSSQIQNTMLSRNTKLLEQDMLMREAEYNALLQRTQVLSGMAMGEKQMYLDQLKNNRLSALQAYGTQLDTMLQSYTAQLGVQAQQNQQVLDMYRNDLSALQVHADITYQAFMAQLGYDQHVMDMAEQEYEAYMAPYYDQLDAWFQDAQLQIAGAQLDLSQQTLDQQSKQATGGYLLGGMGTGAMIGLYAGGPVGAFIGGVLGLIGGAVAASVAK